MFLGNKKICSSCDKIVYHFLQEKSRGFATSVFFAEAKKPVPSSGSQKAFLFEEGGFAAGEDGWSKKMAVNDRHKSLRFFFFFLEL